MEPWTKEAFTTIIIDCYAKANEPDGKGAIFMTVCRGKVSEGLDFTANNPKISSSHPKLLSGNYWCRTDSCCNKAIERIIWHKDDNRAILFAVR